MCLGVYGCAAHKGKLYEARCMHAWVWRVYQEVGAGCSQGARMGVGGWCRVLSGVGFYTSIM